MKYTKRVLKNGLRLVTISGLSTNAVTMAIYVKGGFRFDFKDKPGISHFVEHIIFNSKGNSSKSNNLAQIVEGHGGWRDAFTWIEHQEHMIHLPKNNLEDGLKLLVKTVFEPNISNSEIQKEKGVIKEEILRNKADPSRAIWDYAWLPLFFQGTNLARPYSGTSADVSSISKSDVKSFISKYFRPENSVMFVAGDIDHDYVQKIAEKYSEKYKKNYKREKINPIAFKNNKQVSIYEDPFYHQTSLCIGIKTVPFKSPLKYRLDILKEMLAGYFNAPLIQKLRDEGGLVYAWFSFHENLSDTGYLFLNITTAHKNVKQVAYIILKEFKRFADGKFSSGEIEIARNHLIGSVLVNTETGQDYIKWYGLQELLNPLKVVDVKEKVKLYKKITYNEIRESAKFFSKNNIFIAAIGKADKPTLLKLI